MRTLNVTFDRDMPRMEVPLTQGESLLGALLEMGVALTHDCDGAAACATCLVIVRDGMDALHAVDEDEQYVLDRAARSEPGSRAACLAIATGGTVVVEIPKDQVPQVPALRHETSTPVVVSARAARHFAAQLAKRGQAAAVRLAVAPAGCSGLRYRIDYADAIDTRDTVFECEGIRIAVDPESLPFIQGSHVDVTQEGLGQRLRFDNPNVRQACGCGESFGT
jgi:iron-sulfur cluster assembly protein